MNTEAEWTDSPEYPGYQVKVIKHGCCTIELFRPILDKAERAKREAQVKAAAEAVLRSYYRRKEQESCQTQS